MPEKMIIIGSGPAGLTAAIYAARANLNPFLIEGFMAGGSAGGQLMTTDIVENFPGFPEGILGSELIVNMKTQATRFGVRSVMEDISKLEIGETFKITSSANKEYEANALIVATGATARRLPLPSEEKLWGKGISACAVCDGGLPMFRDKELAVIGGGDSAVEEAMHLTKFGSKVYLIHRRDELRASKIMRERAMNHPKIEILWNKVPEEFLGDDLIRAIKLKDTKTGEFSELPVAGAFEAIGHIPNTAFLNNQVELDEQGYILTRDATTLTNVDGLFAAGDVQDKRYRQAISAAGSGCMAALDAEKWLTEKGLL